MLLEKGREKNEADQGISIFIISLVKTLTYFRERHITRRVISVVAEA